MLVRKAVEQSRLLPGENAASAEPGDALHWINVYSELLAFKSRMLTDMTTTVRGMSQRAASEVVEIDVELVERQRRRYAQRLAAWEARAREIAGMKPAPKPKGG